MAENNPENPRQKCPKCGAVYRWPVDFEEHLSVGCEVKSASRKASLKAEPEDKK